MLGSTQEDAGNFGVSRFQEKQAALEEDKNNSVDAERALELSRELAKELSKELRNVASTFRENLVPGFIRRFLNRKTYNEMTQDVERKQDGYFLHVNSTIQEHKAYHEEKMGQRKLLKSKNRQQDMLGSEGKKDIAADKAQREEVKAQEYLDRRTKQLDEVQSVIDAHVGDIKSRAEADLLAKRAYNLSRWTEQSRLLLDEAVSNKKAKLDSMHRILHGPIEEGYSDWADRELSRAKLQVEAEGVTSPDAKAQHKGLFGEHYDDESRGGKVGMADVHSSSSDSSAYHGYEADVVEFDDVKSQAERLQTLYNALSAESLVQDDAIARMTMLSEAVTRDSQQIRNEVIEVELTQLGPPRRMPAQHEKQPLHIRKSALASLENTNNELAHCLGQAKKKKMKCTEQMLILSKQIASLREQQGEKLGDIESANNGLGILPIIVGRSIVKVPGNSILTAAPLKTLQAVTQQSKFVQTRELVNYAMKIHRERNALDQQLWVSKQSSNETKTETNYVMNRLAEVAERMKKASLNTLKLNLIDALSVFQARKVQLRHVSAKESGLLLWYSSMQEQLSHHCIPFQSKSLLGDLMFEIDSSVDGSVTSELLFEGVTLAKTSRSGICAGVISLPKLSLWNFLLTVTMDGEMDRDVIDTVVIHLGPSVDALVLVGSFTNTINPDTGTILYDVSYAVRSEIVAYRFEFTTTNPLAPHLAVGVGCYEQYEMKPLEIFVEPSGRERMLSSYVKLLRIDEKQGKFRETKLLEELVALEGSSADFWDSDLVSHTSQRFNREYYLRILKVEILLEQKQGNAALAAAVSARSKALSVKLANRQYSHRDQKVEQSKTEFLQRKRARQSHVLDAGNALMKRRLEIFDSAQNRWRHVLVQSCIVRWLDNGLTAKCTHSVQEHNEGNELLGVEFEVDLSKIRWFESAVQDIDDVAMERWRRQRVYEARLNEISSAVENQIVQLRASYNEFRRSEEDALQKQVARSTTRLEESIDSLARMRAEEPDAQKAIRQGVSAVLLEMKMGIICVQPEIKPGILALQISKERFVERWILDKKRETMEDLLNVERRVEDRINARRLQFIEFEANIIDEANRERYVIMSAIREYRQQEKEKLMKRVVFDTKKFQLILPKTRVCAHPKTKAWGDKYSTGLRCESCGKELSNVHKEESQTLGYGTGTDDEMYNAIKRHRSDEISFRFKTANELADVEEERLRLEKERREMELSEAFFYDFQDLSVIYDFDRRHAQFIKNAGIFRQGLQWKEPELRTFERKKFHEEIERLAKENLVQDLIEKFDPLSCIQEPPPTFRAADERRKAQYTEFMFMMGRLVTYQRKVALLKETRLELLADRKLYSANVEQLHKDSYAFDTELSGIEQDLDKTGLLLATYERMQILWRQATRILIQADKDMRKAAMKHCGVWENVQEQRDKTMFVHDETLELLRIKFLFDSSKGSQGVVLDAEKQLFEEKAKNVDLLLLNLHAVEYCKPGDPILTRFGFAWIRSYRKRDGMVLATLSFGEPSAKIWVRAQEIIQAERSRQAGELKLMNIEDERTKAFLKEDRERTRRERLAMQASEYGIRDYYHFVDLGKRQDEVVFRGIDRAVQDQYGRLNSANFLKLQEKIVNRKSVLWKERENTVYYDYVGPAAGRPRKPTMWRVYKYRQDVTEELKIKFLSEAAGEAEKATLENFYKVRSEWIQKYTFEQLFDQVVSEWCKIIAKETYGEGKFSKDSAERMSGIAFPQPKTMQFNVYRSLVDIWKRRKLELKTIVEMNMGFAAMNVKANTRPVLGEGDFKVIRARRRILRNEKRRQAAMCQLLEAEEALSRTFYKWELAENLRERRFMSQEECDTKAHIKVIKKQREAERQARINNGSAAAFAPQANSAEARRAQLKETTLHLRRQEEDRAFMILEDKAGEVLREIDRIERQRALVAKTIGEGNTFQGETSGATASGVDSGVVEIPEWMVNVPPDWDSWALPRQRNHIDELDLIRLRALTRQNNIALEEKFMDALEAKAYRDWKGAHGIVLQEATEQELAVMHLSEKCRSLEYEIKETESNIRRISTFCREKGEEELRCNTDLRKLEHYARRREKELKEATAWFELCVKRARQRDKVKRRVVANCLWIDTDSITGFHQRFQTSLLRKRLYEIYFQRITAQIVTRAEIIASERRLMGIQERLSVNKATLIERTYQMKERWKEIQRDEYMRMRKSILNEKLFPYHRREVLLQRFSSWVRFYLWNRGHREAFELRYEVLKRQMDIQRQYRSQLSTDRESAAFAQSATVAESGLELTPMQRHREHLVLCHVCQKFYLDSQNNSTACSYHPGLLAMDCPNSCPAPGFTPLCQSHRIRRWRCCDSIKVDSAGCCRRNHSPAADDAIYSKMISAIRQRDTSESAALDAKLDNARKMNWPLQMMELKRGQVGELEDRIAAKRSLADKYFNLKFV